MTLPRLPDLQPRERLLAIGSGIALLVVLLDRLVLSPWMRHAQAIRQDIRHMEEELLSHERLLARKDRLLVELQRHQRYLHPAVADDLQTAALLKEIEQLAGQSHVTIDEIKPLPSEADEISRRYALDVRFACAPEEWADFVYRLETSPSLFEVQRATLARQEDTPDQLAGSLRVVSAALQTEPALPGLGQGGIDAAVQ
jgi:Tfp pilus assembly protein PilO